MEPLAEKRNAKRLVLWLTGIILTSVFVSLITLGVLIFNENAIYENVYVESVGVGHLTKDQAKEKLQSVFENELGRHYLKLKHYNTTWDYSYEELGFSYLYQDAVEEAYSVGRRGNFFNRLREVYQLRKKPMMITINTFYDSDKLEAIIEEVNLGVYREPVDANIERKNGVFVVTKEVEGVEMDAHELRRLMREAVESYRADAVTIPVQYVVPTITEEQLSQIQDVMGEFSTVFNAEVTGRSANISIASNSIDHKILMPGETFSFNKQTGPRGVKEGYQEAPVILNGKLVPGVGGGICQVSTTLYNAVVRADLEVIERRNHSLPVSYVPLGQDATVSYGFIDFQFINNTQYPLFIESSIYGSKISVRIYGKSTQDYSINLHSNITETIEPKAEIMKDPTLFVGDTKMEKEAKTGYRVETYKIYMRNNKEFMRELISKDLYIPVHGLTFEGTKPRPQAEGNTKIPDKEENPASTPTDVEEVEEEEKPE
ncbi:VanW family protein [Alkaliphilus hydrothermalis]|uniref:Vancomycin resistance protein YoaR n=1 Tax=Alkaliphilus hydrothermalis TaxID=1482730 RepID=A0ABS2NN91_9FIRM|nr:VanW family protein [Alkaliphilus hydrothermalis]MBM7614420.1 vancomycin resistance protein YoaR [Alkaliphilus hydrothermalis]